jgi:hypothetical protein
VLLSAMSSLLFAALQCAVFAFAYFSQYISKNASTTLEINNLFDRLDPAMNPTGEWGTDGNPYLINQVGHLHNLSILQNTEDRKRIDEDSVFQVSTNLGAPIYVGSDDYNALTPITSIGTEEFPFVSVLRGVKATNSLFYATLPTGEVSDTSAIGNIRVTAKPGQVDIGLFGNLGPTNEEAASLLPGQTIGGISNLLLYNIQVASNAVGAYDANHKHFVSNPTYNGLYETNHIGILVGHAQFADIHDISVYYSGENNNPHVKAFDVDAGSSARYATSGGIVGYYNKIVVDEETEYPVSSDGSPQRVGTNYTGLDLGIVYTEDLWTFMEKNTSVGNPAPLDTYDLQDTFDNELYGASNPDKKYFQIGVFTFSHSKQVKGNDRIAKLWATSGSNMWTISTDNTYTAADSNLGTAKEYTLTQITSANVNSSARRASDNPYHTVTGFSNTDYRFMFVYTDSSTNTDYALMRYGAQAISQKIDINNFIIQPEDLDYYTFKNLTNRVTNLNYPPYETNWSYEYNTANSIVFTRNANNPRMQYTTYGDVIENDDNVIVEAPRPFRVYYSSAAPTASFMATSSNTNPEGLRIIPEGSGNLWGSRDSNKPAYSRYRLQRMTATNGSVNWYATFSDANGFSATDNINNAAYFKIYAVRITNNPSQSSENPTDVPFTKKVYTPTGTTKTYDMSKNTLYYTGTASSGDPDERYMYDIKTIESLGWAKNDGLVMKDATKGLMMADPTSYYYISNRFWGVTQGIPAPNGVGTINVPEGSIGFTVQGTQQSNTYAKIYVMVATNPGLYVDQTITVSRFGTGNNQNGDRSIEGTFVLPPSPGRTVGETQPIYINDSGSDYTAYPNFNVLPVAYEFVVDAQYTTTYFLESSRGSATFIYLSAERTAARDNNPTHDNNVKFPQLTSVDYVFKGIENPDKIATVGSDEYINSLTSPYFGVMANPDNLSGTVEGIDQLIVPSAIGFDFTYAIQRYYNAVDEEYTIFIDIVANVDGAGYDPPNNITQVNTIMDYMNFNFSEWSFLDSVNNVFVYSDSVIIKINGYAIADWELIT